MSFISKLFGSGTKGIGELAKDLREAIKGKELDPNKQIETATKLAELQAKIDNTPLEQIRKENVDLAKALAGETDAQRKKRKEKMTTAKIGKSR